MPENKSIAPQDPAPTFEHDLLMLGNQEAFARFINYIANLREEEIARLHEANTEKLQQISGRILAYDELLRMVDWEAMQRRYGG